MKRTRRSDLTARQEERLQSDLPKDGLLNLRCAGRALLTDPPPTGQSGLPIELRSIGQCSPGAATGSGNPAHKVGRQLDSCVRLFHLPSPRFRSAKRGRPVPTGKDYWSHEGFFAAHVFRTWGKDHDFVQKKQTPRDAYEAAAFMSYTTSLICAPSASRGHVGERAGDPLHG
jgi:hypothetical protein